MSCEKYKLSIRLMTFNHAKFIDKAIQGILIQKTNFIVEVVIGDDFSSDGTLEKIKMYENTTNLHFKILDRKKGDEYCNKRQKLGRLYNFTNILENCSGEYIALLDGDDYWVDPLKLQKQVDFLEKNKSYSIIASNAYTNLKDKHIIYNTRKGGDFSCKEILLSNFIPTASIVFRKENLIIPEFFFSSPAGDWLLMTYLLINKKGYYDSDPLVFYRLHDNGIWSSLENKNDLKTILQKNKIFIGNYNIFSKMKKDSLFNKEELQIIEKKRNSYGYQYNRSILFNSKIKLHLKRIPLAKFNLATIVKLLILRLKVYKI